MAYTPNELIAPKAVMTAIHAKTSVAPFLYTTSTRNRAMIEVIPDSAKPATRPSFSAIKMRRFFPSLSKLKYSDDRQYTIIDSVKSMIGIQMNPHGAG